MHRQRPGRARLPLRPCVGIMLINKDGLVWVGRRLPKWKDDLSQNMWQMPQGGIDRGEKPNQAAMRELREEIGTDQADIIARTRGWLTYELPKNALGVALKGKYRGQKQKWFAMKFTGSDDAIDIRAARGEPAEFDAWKWIDAKELPGLVVPFKRPVYEQVLSEFRHLVG